MTNLYATFLAGSLSDHGSGCERPLLIPPAGAVLSYADAERESARLARFMTELGLETGDRVTVQAPKSPQLLWLYLACLRGGFIYQPLNDAYRKEELEYFVNDARPALVVCAPEQAGLFTSLNGERSFHVLTLAADGSGTLNDRSAAVSPDFATIECAADTIAALLYSSGTTGRPKGAMLTHGNLAANTRALVEAWGFSAADRLLHALPIYHAHGLFVAVGCVMLSGASMIFLPKFDARELMHHMREATVMMGVPTFYTRLLDEPGFGRETCASIRLFVSGSAPLRPETHQAFANRTGHAILERYGMTETCMNSANPLTGERRPGSVGPALPGVSIRIADDADRPVPPGMIGEVQIKGPNVFAGYWGMPEKTVEEFTTDGFFRTGDQGLLSDDGYLSIVGRNKDLIISGGLNVFPREIEQVIDALDGVAESAVIGVPHPDFGEGVVAVVVREAGRGLSGAEVIDAVAGRLANFKIPKRVFFVDELPRNAMSKVAKNVLREKYHEVLA